MFLIWTIDLQKTQPTGRHDDELFEVDLTGKSFEEHRWDSANSKGKEKSGVGPPQVASTPLLPIKDPWRNETQKGNESLESNNSTADSAIDRSEEDETRGIQGAEDCGEVDDISHNLSTLKLKTTRMRSPESRESKEIKAKRRRTPVTHLQVDPSAQSYDNPGKRVTRE